MKKNHKSKFNTPEGYFESFNDRLMARINQEDDTEISTEFLPESDGFGLPEGYFETLENQVLSQTTALETKVIPLFSKKIYYAAASIAAIFVLGFLFLNQSEPELGFDDLASAEIDAYFESNEIGLTTYELAEYVNVDEMAVSDVINEKIEDDVILEYLDENVEKIEDLNLDYEAFE